MTNEAAVRWVYIANGLGDFVDAPTAVDIRDMLTSMDLDDEEHGEVWMCGENDDDGISWFVDGRILRRRSDAELCALTAMTPERAVEVFVLFAAGDFEALAALPWEDGDGDHRTPEQREADDRQRQAEYDQWRAKDDQEFIEELGEEHPDPPCRHEGCVRGTVEHSALCRVHHFEMMTKRPYPFD